MVAASHRITNAATEVVSDISCRNAVAAYGGFKPETVMPLPLRRL